MASYSAAGERGVQRWRPESRAEPQQPPSASVPGGTSSGGTSSGGTSSGGGGSRLGAGCGSGSSGSSGSSSSGSSSRPGFSSSGRGGRGGGGGVIGSGGSRSRGIRGMWRGAEDGARCCSPERGDAGLAQLLRAAGADVRKCGYLRKQKHGHKRYFVLRTAGRLAPARLEYYESEKKFRSSLRAAAAAGASASAPPAVPPKRAIPLDQCFTVSRRADAKHRHLIALYTKDDYFAMVAESEQEQESWYQALSLLMGQSKARSAGGGREDGSGGGGGCRGDPDEGRAAAGVDGGGARAAVGEEEEDGSFKEVWQVQVKPKGLGQSKHLSGLYRLCLSSKEVHLVRPNAEVASVQLQLLSIRRCGHSEHFFFLEVGRSSSIGPGEIWMQVDDAVVAQHMHETFLETMKALKAFPDFRPRSKSQSACPNPISFLASRRHLGYLQPCLGMSRRSRTDSMTGTPPSCKTHTYRFRTSSEGEGTLDGPFRTVTASLLQLNPGRGSGAPPEGGRYVRAAFHAGWHGRSASLPVSPFAAGSSPAPEGQARPASCAGGAPGDRRGSPGDKRYFRLRSGTPDPLGSTPPIREEQGGTAYMSMNPGRAGEGAGGAPPDADKGFKKRTFSLPKAAPGASQQKTTQTPAGAEEGAGHGRLPGACESPRSREPPHLEDGAHRKQGRQKAEDDGYVPMMPGVAAALRSDGAYLPMAPRSAAADKPHASWSSSRKDSRGYMMMFPRAGLSLGRGPRGALPSKGGRHKDDDSDYMDMSPGQPGAPKQPPEAPAHHPPSFSKSLSSLFSRPKSFRTMADHSENGDYVPMASPGSRWSSGSDKGSRVHRETLAPKDLPRAPGFKAAEGFLQRKTARPTKLPLAPRGSSIPRIYERATEGESPGEYINIDFGRKGSNPPYPRSAECSPSSFGSSGDHTQSPFSDYMTFALDVPSPKAAKELARSLTSAGSGLPRNQLTVDSARRPPGAAARARTPPPGDEDYTEMSFNPRAATTVPLAAQSNEPVKMDSPSSAVHRLRIADSSPEGSTLSLPDGSPEAAAEQKGTPAAPQGRRRHSSETFSPTGAAAAAGARAGAGAVATPASLLWESRRQSSASFDSIWFKSGEGASNSETKMSRVTSAGFQNGLNYIALNPRDAAAHREAASAAPNSQPENGASALDRGTYVSIDFSKDDLFKCTSAKKD